MELIEITYKTKVVDYFGILLIVPINTLCIATDGNGWVHGFPVIPIRSNYYEEWSSKEHCIALARVNLKDIPWDNSLRYVRDICNAA